MVNVSPPPAVVIGTGRCGTGYMHTVLTRCGHTSGHEHYFNAGLKPPRPGLDVECSWLAVPALINDRYTDRILHIVRHPYDVVSSLMGIGFFDLAPEHWDTPFATFARESCPAIQSTHGITAAAWWWREWNEQCRFIAADTIRIEDFADLPGVQARASRALGLSIDVRVVKKIPKNINHKKRHVLSGEEKSVVRDICSDVATSFGYRLGAVQEATS